MPVRNREPVEDIGHLISVATELAERLPYSPSETRIDATFQSFVKILREWIIEYYDLPGSQVERVEKTRLLLHLMIGGSTLGDSIALLERFRTLVWGDRGIRTIFNRDCVTLVCKQPFRRGPSGLVSDLWSLSFLLTEFEFLAGGPLEGVVGRVRQPAYLPSSTARLLFDHPFEYGADALSLTLPRRHLRRPVVAQANDIDRFLQRLVPHTVGAGKAPRALTKLVAGMIQAETRQASEPSPKLESVAEQLGLSPATLRRRLTSEGSNYRKIKERVLGELAKEWLSSGLSVQATAERLGYSDAFAFRRAFRRRQHCSPAAYKRTTDRNNGERVEQISINDRARFTP